MTAVLEVDHLTKKFHDFYLDHIHFSLEKGCITGFIGTNGSGKTTTIKSILGLIHKDDGKIRIFGEDAERNERSIKDRIGFVMDEGYFYENLTLQEMKRVIASAYTRWDEKSFLSYINRFQLNLQQKIAKLSKGMRMKFAVALALSHHADLLIMDEPTSGLDPLVRSELMQILIEFVSEENKSAFFSTHITSDLERIADMLILIDDGKILFEKEKDELLESHVRVKGDNNWINEETRPLFLSLNQSHFGFDGVTNQKNAVLRAIPGAVLERTSIEDVMLAYVGGEKIAD
ncbi:ABC transporter ATP-binding protein [Sporolactobacillus sp. CPB3-1]|uniref:ABC transporter ATP-binding protein n=1 Tax=Sporolactobacillus mangiferae TaxID=2940498 RepID=A0ABT0MD54_9BACL|nr:ABC transporter ATP-binding protein [Sporolactobacillus mangiferae]MCL1632810.1 ABC transporter ATP-binding protein [Sporolactobacillus mangiferae]